MKAHDYDCTCERCENWHKAIAARNPNGSYCLTDDELYALAMQEESVSEAEQLDDPPGDYTVWGG